ncbi:hypothetical protein GALMADRAFT_81227 [Galerina marginata CBS 339.88]|uniref:Zn(2)-C6 fungal-type domain-containing protein n=1 Tax=Galerina marginata (strain CBS 339.88) TaxID=685588 RepID=A0A067S5Q9_GALM3|nr:hypothetical protein GALMADRAFT_81227 [Galerina marginata CBS 339.88]
MTLECKRRKIKCDRTQPCAPCTRRGEEAGCQWHIVEPVEKYATKAEFDDLKSRFEALSDLVQRLLPSATAAGLPYYPMGVSPGMPGVAGEAVQPYHSGTSGPIGYSSMMPPPPPQPPQPQQGYGQHLETSSQATNRYMKPEGTQSPTRHVHQSLGGVPSTSPIISSALHNPSLSRHRLENSPTSAAATVKNSPLSLASITSPYHPDSSSQLQQAQSKNYHAQTLILGERLRPGSEDPMNIFAKTRPQSAQEHQLATPLTRRCISIVPRRRRRRVPHLRRLTTFSLVLRDGLVIRPRARLLCRQGTTIGPA